MAEGDNSGVNPGMISRPGIPGSVPDQVEEDHFLVILLSLPSCIP